MGGRTPATRTPQLICERCGRPAPPVAWQCPRCQATLTLTTWPTFDPRCLRDEQTLWRYGALLAVPRNVSLGEGFTPLVPCSAPPYGHFWAKLEFLAPTGSYKDRGTAVLVNHLVAHGVTEVVEDSSGNAGASLAAYAAAASVRATVFVPAHASSAKKRQIAVFGARLVEVPGPRTAAAEACRRAAQQAVSASHAWNPLFLLGQMTVVWELWEQLGGTLPDAVICPLGQGGLLLGLWYGSVALRRAGLVDRLPRLYGVQAAACDPIVRAWECQADVPLPVGEGATVAEGVRIATPVRGREVLAALRATAGEALRVDDRTILDAQATLARRGLFVEPTSATAVAALPVVRRRLSPSARIVVPLTGSGLKEEVGDNS
ncbi:MAG: pyridoxal-phosphate dependent enzyme [Ardenticatenia bacterium]|nr:pyridoxal-phosphate dependent enzyme [Ardenticatenia bacterium]